MEELLKDDVLDNGSFDPDSMSRRSISWRVAL